MEVTTSEIKYKKFDNLDGPTFSILKSEVLIIRYKNGTKDVFNIVTPVEATVTEQKNENDMFSKCIFFFHLKLKITFAFLGLKKLY